MLAGRFCEAEMEAMMCLKELEAESAKMQSAMPSQLFALLPRLRGGWWANPALQRPPLRWQFRCRAQRVLVPGC
jgi:hypothetical protein